MTDVLVPTDKIDFGGKTYFTGRKPSPVDHRDVPYALVANTDIKAPESYNVEESVTLPVYNQENFPACVGWTFSLVKSYQEYLEHGRILRFDGLSLYRSAGGQDDGITMRQGAEATRTIGAPEQARSGLYKIQAYAGVATARHEAVKHAIYTNGVCAGAFNVPAFFMDGGGKEFKVGDKTGTDIVGGHAIGVTGYDPHGPWLHNSWDLTWGEKGRLHVTWDFWDTYFDELWTTVDLRDSVVASNFARFRRSLANAL